MSKLQFFESLFNIPDDLIKILELYKEKQVEFVIRDIKIGLINFTTIDVKLPVFKEDSLYNNENIRILVPRGLCFIFVNNNHIHTLYGHPKFGNKGDYNNKNLNIDSMKKVFRTKENGECAHWGAFKYLDQVYEIYGSKNVHMIVRTNRVDEDLLCYNDVRYIFAKKIGILINALNKTNAIEYLISSKNTLCAEACFTDSQHLVEYGKSSLYFFAVTGKRSSSDNSIVVVSPLDVDNFVESLGLNKVKETIISENNQEQKNAEKYFENMDNSEGAVVSCLDENNNVVYVYKHKNFDYIFRRALREQMKKNATTQRIFKRFSELHIVHPNYENMIDWALKFNAWYRQGLNDNERGNFFNRWIDWTNKFATLEDDEKDSLLVTHNEYEKSKRTLEVIFFVAMPGSGKSFIAKVVKQLLESNGKKVKHLEQDMFYHLGQKSAGKNYEKAIGEAIKDKSLDYLILAKSNHCEQVRNKTYDTLSKCERNVNRTYIVMTTNGGDMYETGKICVDRVMNRGDAHTSLFGMTREQINSIIFTTFVNQWQHLNISELEHNVINLEIDQSKEDIIKSFCTQANFLELGDFNVNEEQLNGIFNVIKREDDEMIKKNENKKKK